MSLVQVIGNAIKTIGIRDDGCIPVTYLQTANGSSQFTQTPMSFLQYVPTSAGSRPSFRESDRPADIGSGSTIPTATQTFPRIRSGARQKRGPPETPTNEEIKEIAFEIAITCSRNWLRMLRFHRHTGDRGALKATARSHVHSSEAMLPLMKELTATLSPPTTR